MTQKEASATSERTLPMLNVISDLIDRAGQLEAANAELALFSFMVAHDLKQPLTVISGYCQELLQKQISGLSADCLQIVKNLNDCAVSLSLLADSLAERAEEVVFTGGYATETDTEDVQARPGS